MQNINPIIIVIIGCCLWPLLTFFMGGFVFIKAAQIRQKRNKPTNPKASSASGRFAVEDDD